MKKINHLMVVALFSCVPAILFSQDLPGYPKVTPAGKGKVNTAVDNMGYWKRMASLGYVEINPYVVVADAVKGTSILQGDGVFIQDSPDVPVSNLTETTQSENSVFIDPEDEEILINSNNSSDWSGATVNNLYGCDALFSLDASATWGGSIYGVGQVNSGDPATAIGRNGWWYVGKINNGWGQSVAYSTNQGQAWTEVVVANVPSGGWDLYDKNHLWIDNSEISFFEGYLYAGWTNFVDGSPRENEIEIARSADHGLTWSSPVSVSDAVNAGKHNQGVNIQTGPAGQVYAAWIIYDSWPSDETAIGFAKSYDGGSIFLPATRSLSNIKGIRLTGAGKGIRTNSFPVMTVDNSGGPNEGTIYLVWANVGIPGINSGSDVDIYMISSADEGETWSAPIKVNQDATGSGKKHFFPWITCDPLNGNLTVIYYDDRNVSSAQLETWVSNSYDGGNTWNDMKVSDVAFTPAPIPGLAINYFGDYLGIQALNMKVYPLWTDNRSGRAMTYVSPFNLGPPPNQPYVLYYSYDLNPIPEKGKGTLNFGDSLFLDLGLKNIGDQSAGNLEALVTTTSSYIQITDSTESYGTMAAGEIKVIPGGYSLKVSDTIPDGLKVKFRVQVTGSDTIWNSHFTVESHAPSLKIKKLTIVDNENGNNNHRLDPGETLELQVLTENNGDFPCYMTRATLSTTSGVVVLHNDSVFLDTLAAGATGTAVFLLSVDEEASIGTGVDLHYQVVSGLFHAETTFLETIGIIVEDWETNSFSKFDWYQFGNKPWTLTTNDPYEGEYCAQSWQISDYETSGLQVTYTSGVPDSISFYRKTSSEPDFDFLHFYIDGILQGSWSGENPWGRVAFPADSGTHTYRWIYSKDIYMTAGYDRVWIDFIEFPTPVLPVVDAGPDDSICAGSVYQLSGSATQADSVRWFTQGDGTFDTDTVLSPVYTPGTSDIINEQVKLMMRGFAEFGSALNSMILYIRPIPVVAVLIEPKDTLCAGQTAILSTDSIEGAAYLWTPGGFTTPVIGVDTSITGGTGTTMFNVVVTSGPGCSNTDSAYITFKDCTGIDERANRFQVSVTPNPSNGIFTVRIHAPVPENVTLRLRNSTNSILFEETGIRIYSDYARPFNPDELTPGDNHIPAGIYFIEIIRANETITRKLIIVQ
jgi:hypothetical protein